MNGSNYLVVSQMAAYTQIKQCPSYFLGGAVVKNPPANVGDTSSSPGPGRSHMPRSN